VERSDTRVAKQAKAHGLIGLGVVARWAHGTKRRRRPALAHGFDGTAGRAARSPRRFRAALHHARVAVQVDGALFAFGLGAGREHFGYVL